MPKRESFRMCPQAWKRMTMSTPRWPRPPMIDGSISAISARGETFLPAVREISDGLLGRSVPVLRRICGSGMIGANDDFSEFTGYAEQREFILSLREHTNPTPSLPRGTFLPTL